MEKKRKKQIIILSVLITITLAFIWIHSCMSMDDSAEESGFVYDLLCPFFELFMGKGNVTEHFIRKLAHFTEFFCLGFELMFFMNLVLLRTKYILRLINAWVLGTFCAIIDESIQILSGRGDMIADIWLDSAGCFTGVLMCSLVVYLMSRKMKA